MLGEGQSGGSHKHKQHHKKLVIKKKELLAMDTASYDDDDDDDDGENEDDNVRKAFVVCTACVRLSACSLHDAAWMVDAGYCVASRLVAWHQFPFPCSTICQGSCGSLKVLE